MQEGQPAGEGDRVEKALVFNGNVGRPIGMTPSPRFDHFYEGEIRAGDIVSVAYDAHGRVGKGTGHFVWDSDGFGIELRSYGHLGEPPKIKRMLLAQFRAAYRITRPNPDGQLLSPCIGEGRKV